MADAGLDPATAAALKQLADIAIPPEIRFVPQTWGWAALLVVVLALLAAALLVWRRRREANRYRREALVELQRIEANVADDRRRREAVLALPPLVKRVALAAWPREAVASLSGAQWVDFLQHNAGPKPFPDFAARLFEEVEYQEGAGTPFDREDAAAFVAATRSWIEGHRVSA